MSHRAVDRDRMTIISTSDQEVDTLLTPTSPVWLLYEKRTQDEHAVVEDHTCSLSLLAPASYRKQGSLSGLFNVMGFCMLSFGERFHCQDDQRLSSCLGILRALLEKYMCPLSFAQE